jgi:signal transduction histidine kinase
MYVNSDDRLIFQQYIERRKYVKDYELKLRKKDGTSIECLVSASARKKSDGTILGYQGVIRDITENKRAEEELLRHQKHLRHLSSQLIEAQEKERKRISLELHDEMGQALTAIGLGLKEIEEKLPSDLYLTMEGILADMNSIIERASEQVSELSLDLRPSMLDDLGLIPTLRWYFNKIGKRTNLEIKFESIHLDERLDPDLETVLYRISQEALNNIIKHADATNVMVRLERKQDSIALYIKDDGKGFDVQKTLMDQLKGRIGLLGMQERASIMRGSLSIQSRKGHGTVILAEMPVGIED